MADRVIQRNDTAARWQSINPVLATGEIGIEIDGAKGYKIGDGKTRWNDLPYPANPTNVVQELGNNENAVPSQKLVTEKLSELGSEVSVFSVMNISNEDTKRKMLKFFKSIRIYDSEIKELSVWNITRGDEYAIRIATMTEGEGYYVYYQSAEKENYIRIDKGNGCAVEMVVDWDILEPNSVVSDNLRRNTLSHKCFIITPTLNDVNKDARIKELSSELARTKFETGSELARTKFVFDVNVENSLPNEYWNFYRNIIQQVRVKVSPSFINEKTRFSLTYLRVESQEEKGPYDGNFIFSIIEDGALKSNGSINLYNYGYSKGFKGILELKDIKPWSSDEIYFDLTINCAAIKVDYSYTLGNLVGDVYEGKIHILQELYEAIDEVGDSFYYESLVNEGTDFPIVYDKSVSSNTYLNNCILDAAITAPKMYRVNVSYINRAETNTSEWDNTVGFQIFDEEENSLGIYYFRNDEKIKGGASGIYDAFYYVEALSITIRIRWKVENMPPLGAFSYGQQSSDVYYNKIPFSPFVFTIVPSMSLITKDSFYYNVDANKGKEFPIWIDSEVSRTNWVIKQLLSFVLFAEIVTSDSIDDYTYEVAYVRKATSNNWIYDNTIQLGRRKRSDLTKVELVNIPNIEDLMLGNQFWINYQWDNALIRLYLDGSAIPSNTPIIISNEDKSAVAFGKQYFDKYCYTIIPRTEYELNLVNTQAVKVIDDALYIGSKYDDNYDILITFKQCMFNELMTFYQVGLAENSKPYALPNPERGIQTVLNRASSDNIGPIAIRYGGWTGANHSYKDEGIIKTAESINFEFYADGKRLKNGDMVYANSVEVKVKNRIFNPTISPTEGNTILSSELCIEDVIYKVKNGNIFVSLSHTYSNDESVRIVDYYGMQSMCYFEESTMTPNGAYNEFSNDTSSFNKGDYPDFNRIIERNAEKTLYQSTYLLPYADGKHNNLSDSNRVYKRESGKQYHVILTENYKEKGDIVNWAGLYTWFKAIRDDESALVYIAEMNGKTLLFVDAKKAIQQQYIEVPAQLVGMDFEVVEKSDSISIGDFITSNGLSFSSENYGTLIISFRINN